jgi:mono/diheme cytochrome c family protein
MQRSINIALLLAAIGSWFAQTLHSQTRATVLGGVYTAAQAARGEAAFGTTCAKCHEGADVDGPPLNGDPFIDRWREDSLDALFDFMKTQMPRDEPGKLTAGAYVDILAYLLSRNSFPAGGQELTAGTLGQTQLVGKDGPKPLPTNALVQVVGCFTPGSNNTWTLTNASEPARTRNADKIAAEELTASANTPLGTQAFGLQNLADLGSSFHADANKGHRILAKGVLLRRSAGDRINVISIGSAAPACGP